MLLIDRLLKEGSSIIPVSPETLLKGMQLEENDLTALGTFNVQVSRLSYRCTIVHFLTTKADGRIHSTFLSHSINRKWFVHSRSFFSNPFDSKRRHACLLLFASTKMRIVLIF